MTTRLNSLLVALLVLAPSIAAACPNCIGGSSRNTTILKVVGAFMLVPFGIVYFVQRAVRQELRKSPDE